MENKTMGKIEKLKLPKTPLSPFQLGYQDESGRKIMVWEIAEKLNDVIDYINQSPKQPEKEVPIMQVEDELGSYWVADNHVEEYPEEPEEQRLEYECGTLEILKNPKLRKELLQGDNQVIKKNLTTEKQKGRGMKRGKIIKQN